jgi:UPF0755 protein
MSAAKRRRRGIGSWITAGVFVACAAFAWYVWSSYAGDASPAKGSSHAVRVVVPRGASMSEISAKLAASTAIRAPRLFRLYASVGGRDRLIKPGTYQFEPATGWRDALDDMVSGKGVVHTVTIPEGFNLREIVPLLAKALSVPEDSVRAAASDTAWQHKLDIPIPSLEGYLFPATYSFAEGTTARAAVNAMLEAFENAWAKIPNSSQRLQAMAVSRHDIVTMASIVETEAKKSEERPIIAAVYWNRVKKGMLLQADPTVQYALPKHVDRVLYKDLEVDSKFNTYKYAGLPPGPIASPGEASLIAALNPTAVPYLYFVASADGHHEFRTTFAEHEKAIASVKKARKAAATPRKK